MTSTTSLEQEPPSVGQILRAARLQQNLTLEQISKTLCINKRQLSQLEEDEEHLTCDVYTLGFIKLYAQYLKLNTQEVIEKFKEQASRHPQSPQLIFSAPLPGRGMPSFRIIALSLIALTVLGIGVKWVSNYSSAPYPHPEIVIAKIQARKSIKIKKPALALIQQTVVPSFSTQQTTFPPIPIREMAPVEAMPAKPRSTSKQVNLKITEEAWIEVKDKEGNIVLNKLFRPGDSFEFKNSENLILKTGNLKGTHLSSGGKFFPVSEKSGEVKRDILLDPEKWLEHPQETH